MKYTIEGYQQTKLIEFGMDCTDAVILRWFADYANSRKMKTMTRNGETLYWVCYDYLIADVPVIGIKNKEALARRLKKMVAADVLIHCTSRKGGVFSYYGFGQRYSELLFSTEQTDSKVESKPTQKSEPSDSKVGTKILQLDDPSTTYKNSDASASAPVKEPSAFKKIVDLYFELHEKHTGDKPLFSKKDGALLKNLLKQRPDIEAHGGALDRMRLYYESRLLWFTKDGGQDIAGFVQHYNALVPPKEDIWEDAGEGRRRLVETRGGRW